MKHKCPEPKAGAPEWMATYSDLVTLLMCFFVLLFAFSNVDQQKFDALMASFQGAAGVLTGGTAFSESPLPFDGLPENQTSQMEEVNEDSEEKEKKEQKLKEDLENLGEKLSDMMDSQPVDLDIELIENPTSIVLRFKDELLFDRGSAVLKESAFSELRQIGEVIKSEGFEYSELIVEGHTDSSPIDSENYGNKWALSSARAASVTEFFVNDVGIDPYRIKNGGYAEYKPIATNSTELGKAMNRRVDIIIKAEGDE